MSTNLKTPFSLSSVDPLFKTKFLKYYEDTFNTNGPLWAEVEKTNDFTGKKLEFPVPIGYQGGVGSGVIPESNIANYGDVQITSKKIYATSLIDRESIMASLSDEGAFKKLIAEAVMKTVEADMWNHNRMLFGDGTGTIGTLDTSAVTDNGGGNYSLIISAATFKVANFEENMFINISSGNTDLFVIQSVTVSTRVIVVQRQAGGTKVPVDSDVLYLQGSQNNDITGLKVLQSTGGSAYNVTIARRWQAFQLLSWGAGITPQALNKLMLGVEKQTGKAPNLMVTSYLQYEKILNQLESQKRYSLTSMSPKLKGALSFEGVQFMSSQGPIKIFPDKFCEDDTLYALNTDFIKYFRRPNSGWVKDDIGGNGYLRVIDEDQFEARFATYGQLFFALPFHGVITGLTTT